MSCGAVHVYCTHAPLGVVLLVIQAKTHVVLPTPSFMFCGPYVVTPPVDMLAVAPLRARFTVQLPPSTHCPALHVWPLGHALPHVPQLAGSICRLAQY